MSKEVKYYMDKGIPVAKVIINRGTRSFPIFGILTIIFVIAKLFDKLDWSWFMVFWPLWIMPAIILGFIVGCLLFAGILLLIALILDVIGKIHSKIKWRKKKNS